MDNIVKALNNQSGLDFQYSIWIDAEIRTMLDELIVSKGRSNTAEVVRILLREHLPKVLDIVDNENK